MIRYKDILSLFDYLDGSFSVSGGTSSISNRLLTFGRDSGFVTGIDVLGSVAYLINGISYSKKRTVAVLAHMDSVGYIISDVYKDEFELTVIGSPDVYVEHRGVVYKHDFDVPPIDCIIRRDKTDDEEEEHLAYGRVDKKHHSLIEIGDFVSFSGAIRRKYNNRVVGPYIDNRAGMVAILAAISTPFPLTDYAVHIVFSSDEEVGGGASVAAIEKIGPDIIINVDATHAPTKECITPHVNIMLGPYVNESLSRYVHSVAQENKIKSQFAVNYPAYGSDTDMVYYLNGGSACVEIGPACYNLHTLSEETSLGAIANTAKLIRRLLSDINGLFEHIGGAV